MAYHLLQNCGLRSYLAFRSTNLLNQHQLFLHACVAVCTVHMHVVHVVCARTHICVYGLTRSKVMGGTKVEQLEPPLPSHLRRPCIYISTTYSTYDKVRADNDFLLQILLIFLCIRWFCLHTITILVSDSVAAQSNTINTYLLSPSTNTHIQDPIL